MRAGVTVLVGVLLLAGTLFGQDDAFPFGPFRMYASAEDLDAPVLDTRVEAVDVTGRRFVLTEADTGIRRAEVEGQLGRFAAHPALLAALASAYAARHPGAPPIVRVQVIQRWHQRRGGLPTGTYHDSVAVTWDAS